MAKKRINHEDILRMAESYGVRENPLFLAATEQYDFQLAVIRKCRDALETDDRMIVEKEYVKGQENLQPNPIITQLPKLTDSANRTLGVMLDIIERIGRKAETKRFGDIDD